MSDVTHITALPQRKAVYEYFLNDIVTMLLINIHIHSEKIKAGGLRSLVAHALKL